MGVIRSVIQYATSRMPKQYRVPVTTGPDGQLGYGWVRGWDDLRFPATQTKIGSNAKPDFDFTNLGLLFPENDASEKIYIIMEFPHTMVVGGRLRPHIHFLQTSTSIPTFRADYRRYENGGSVPATFTTITTSASTVYTYGSNDIINILEWPEIDTSDITSVSHFMEMIIYRDDADVTGDVLVKEVDVHIEVDYVGSFGEYTK